MSSDAGERNAEDAERYLSLNTLRKDWKSRNLDPESVRVLSDSSLKHYILIGFFACALISVLAGSTKLVFGKGQDSEREAVGLITNVMSGITGIAAGVFTGSALR